jgi:hypothetical protein
LDNVRDKFIAAENASRYAMFEKEFTFFLSIIKEF